MNLFGQPSKITVSSLGLVRNDHAAGAWFGVDGRQWLACFDDCPSGSGARTCVPYSAKVNLTAEPPQRCEVRTAPGEPWHGKETRIDTWICADSRGGTMRYVPSLIAVRDALIDVGFIERGSTLAKIEGLPIEIRAAGISQFFSIESLDEVSCSKSFAYPGGFAVNASDDHFEKMLGMIDRLRRDADKALGQLRLQLERKANEALVIELGTRCLGERDHYDAEEVQRCIEDRPQMARDVEALRQAAQQKLTQLIMKGSQTLVHDMLDGEICRQMAGPEN